MLKSKAKEKHCWTYNCREIGTRKWTLLMLNFYEVFAGRAMVTDAGRVNSFKRKLKAAWLQKKWMNFRKGVPRENRFKISVEKKVHI